MRYCILMENILGKFKICMLIKYLRRIWSGPDLN
nr:MAG TPA: hypothetical protein [Caudoviricetes sp.]